MTKAAPTSPWQRGFPRDILAWMPESCPPVLRLVCKGWRRVVDESVTSLAPNSLETAAHLARFKNLYQLDLRYIPCATRPKSDQPTSPPSSDEIRSSSASACEWCAQLAGPDGMHMWEGLDELTSIYLPVGCCDMCLISAIARFPHLDSVRCTDGKITDAGIAALQDLPLAELHLQNAAYITDRGLEYLAEHGARLRGLVIHGANRITDQAITGLSKNYAKGLNSKKGLHILSLSSCTRIKGEGMGCFPALRSLDLSSCQYVNDLALHDIQHSHQLRVVRLSGCLGVTDAGLEFLRGLNDLQHLDLKGCERISDKGVQDVVSSMRKLRVLILEGMHWLSDNGLVSLKACSGLEKLSLKGCGQVSDVGFESLMPHLPYLQWLDMSGCRRVAQKGLISIARNLRHLRYLAMAHCTGASNAGLAALGAAQLPLTYLNLSSCSRVTGTGLAALLPLAPTLSTLHVSWCDLNDPATLQLQALFHLRHLHMEGCSRVSPSVVSTLLSKLPLETLDTRACSKAVEKMGFHGVQEEEGGFMPVLITPRSPKKTIAIQTDPELELSLEEPPEVNFEGDQEPPEHEEEAAVAEVPVPDDFLDTHAEEEPAATPRSPGGHELPAKQKQSKSWLGRVGKSFRKSIGISKASAKTTTETDAVRTEA